MYPWWQHILKQVQVVVDRRCFYLFLSVAAGLEEDFYQHRTCAAPSPQHQQPQITFHRMIAMTLIIPNSPPDSHPLSLVTLFPSSWLSLPNFPCSPTNSFSILEIPLFSPLCLSSFSWGSIFLAWVNTGWTSIIRRRKEGGSGR